MKHFIPQISGVPFCLHPPQSPVSSPRTNWVFIPRPTWFNGSKGRTNWCSFAIVSTNCPLFHEKSTIPRLFFRGSSEKESTTFHLIPDSSLQPLQPQPPRKKGDRSSAGRPLLGILYRKQPGMLRWNHLPSALSLGQLRRTIFSLEDWKGTIAAATIQNGLDGVNHWLDSHHQIVLVSTAVMAVQCSPKLDQYPRFLDTVLTGNTPMFDDVCWCGL